jgi:hypothetical protein
MFPRKPVMFLQKFFYNLGELRALCAKTLQPTYPVIPVER